MRKLNTPFIFLCLILFSTNINAQLNEANYNGSRHNLTIKSPEQNQLSKFVDIPATSNTGTQSIEIPLYTIEENGIDIPISLKYHVSGIKVNDVATRAGLGWVLSIGDISLSKQIYGKEDKGAAASIPEDFEPRYNLIHREIASQIVSQMSNLDSQPDIYTYSIPGGQGDFFYDSSEKVIKIPQNDISIKRIGLLVDNHGNKYHFITSNLVASGSGPSQSTDFEIEKIEFSNGNIITFEYEEVPSYSYYSNFVKTYTKLITPESGCSTTDEAYPVLRRIISERALKKINFQNGTLEINYTDRLDIPGAKKIDEVIVISNSNTIINYKFNHSYFSNNDRLRLDSINNILDQSNYSFNYFNEYPLPDRLSFATDYIGFYNGASNNVGIPSMNYGGEIIGLGDNKNPNLLYGISGSLKSVTYPTGGTMEIEYENDDFLYEGEEITNNPRTFSIDHTKIGEEMPIEPKGGDILHLKFDFQSSTSHPDNPNGEPQLPEGRHFVGELLDMQNNLIQPFLFNTTYNIQLANTGQTYKMRIRIQGMGEPLDPLDEALLSVSWTETSVQNVRYNKSVGGLRVKSITKKDSNNQKVIKQSYQYKEENGDSSGLYIADPLFYAYTAEYPHDYTSTSFSCKKLVISNTGNFNTASANGKSIAYNRVSTIFENIDSSKNYKTIDYYYNTASNNRANSDSPMQIYSNNKFLNGLLYRKEFYNNENDTVRIIKNKFVYDDHFAKLSADYRSVPDTPSTPFFIFVIARLQGFPIYDFRRYAITSTWVKSVESKTEEFFNGVKLTTKTTNNYSGNYHHLNPEAQIVLFPDSTTRETKYKYAHEKFNQKLIDANITGTPLETTIVENGKTLSKVETVYPDQNNYPTDQAGPLLLPLSVLSYDIADLNQTQEPHYSPSSTVEVSYDLYDSQGNLLQYTTKSGLSTAIIWGYYNTQPIAKVEGATFLEASAIATAIINASNDDADDIENTNPKENILLSALDTFRKNLPELQVTTYSYDPLIGVRSITPPGGIREIYIYDTANRLKEVREQNAAGNLLKEYQYNYKH